MSQNAHAQTLSNVVAVDFGQLVVGGSGTVTIPSGSDTRSATGSVALVGSMPVFRGSVDVSFTPGAQVIVSFPSTIVMAGPNTPTFTPEIQGGTIQTIPLSGTLTIYFGGTVTFTTTTASGVVTCVIPVTVDPF
jgi:hypothetical protein